MPHPVSPDASHLLGARVQILTEMLVLEVLDPPMRRERQADLYDVPLLSFGAPPSSVDSVNALDAAGAPPEPPA